MRQVLVLLLLTMCVAGCATSTTPSGAGVDAQQRAAYMTSEAAANPQLATVYIYREGHFMGMGLRPTVMLGDEDLVNIESGTFYVGKFAAGHQRFRMDDGKSGADVDLHSGETYYFKVNIVPGFWKGSGQILMVNPEQGAYEIRQLRPMTAGEIPDKSHTPIALLQPWSTQGK